MSIYSDAEKKLKTIYRTLWDNWYSDRNDLTPAALILEKVDEKSFDINSLYEIKEDRIRLRLPEVNLGEMLMVDSDHLSFTIPDWPTWQRELIHEMLHEYQYKVVKGKISEEGQALYERFSRSFPDGGHEADFFTALANRASVLGIQPEQLIRLL